MEVILKAKHTFKTDVKDEELFKERFNEILLKVILHLEQNCKVS